MFKSLICHFCQSEFNNTNKQPRILPECQHSICEQCLVDKISKKVNFLCVIDLSNIEAKNLNEFSINRKILLCKDSLQQMERRKSHEKQSLSSLSLSSNEQYCEIHKHESLTICHKCDAQFCHRCVTKHTCLNLKNSIDEKRVFLNQHFSSIVEQNLDKVNSNLKEVLKLKFLNLCEVLIKSEEEIIDQIRKKFKETFEDLNLWYQKQKNQLIEITRTISLKFNTSLEDSLASKSFQILDLKQQLNQLKGQLREISLKQFRKFKKKMKNVEVILNNPKIEILLQQEQIKFSQRNSHSQTMKNNNNRTQKNFLKKTTNTQSFANLEQPNRIHNVYDRKKFALTPKRSSQKFFYSNNSNSNSLQKLKTKNPGKKDCDPYQIEKGGIFTIEDFQREIAVNSNLLDLTDFQFTSMNQNHFFTILTKINKIDQIIFPCFVINSKLVKLIAQSLAAKQIKIISFKNNQINAKNCVLLLSMLTTRNTKMIIFQRNTEIQACKKDIEREVKSKNISIKLT